jgi:hypothetical protein
MQLEHQLFCCVILCGVISISCLFSHLNQYLKPFDFEISLGLNIFYPTNILLFSELAKDASKHV